MNTIFKLFRVIDRDPLNLFEVPGTVIILRSA